ncbi:MULTISPECIES: hypothetical protein [unclassified Pseudomonas]|uniref:hypothetical protein n=1 Tax=unclassified Pseudomonas TaxID=196821 RepID=UPI00384CC684
MKTLIAFLITLVLAAISASALAMPCGQKTRSTDEAQDSQHLMRLHVARQNPVGLKLPGRLPRLDV